MSMSVFHGLNRLSRISTTWCPGLMRDARKSVFACCPGLAMSGSSSSHTSPPGGSLVSSKPVPCDGSSVTVSPSGCPALSSMFWSLRA
jgi:hypothetical protein